MSEGVPKGSVAAGTRVRLPEGAEPPVEVFVNGVRRSEGVDFRIERDHVVFAEPIVKEQVSGARWIAMFLGLFGSYGKNEIVDVQYQSGGAAKLISDAEILP
ncbi:MAG TPA: hypothetical protein VFY99_03985 [Solirubrobacterales bacterium]